MGDDETGKNECFFLDHHYHKFDIYSLPLCQEDIVPETTLERAICYSVQCFA